MNRTLSDTRAASRELGEEPDESIAVLIAETRVLVLEQGKKEFAENAGMHFHAISNAERSGSAPQHKSMSRVYRYWEQIADPEQYKATSRVRQQLWEACEKLLDLLVPDLDEYDRPLRRTVEGEYWRWVYQVGEKAFFEATAYSNERKKPLTKGTLWQRHEMGTVPDFEEPRIIGRILERDLADMTEIWTEQKSQQLLQRGV
ncbi:MAG: hypothetical protein IIA50_04500, partial [Bacteroidetes bacterium]|nr:hypothetical protein [Bacteroidota bacterium]